MTALNGIYVTFTVEQNNNSFADFGLVDIVVTIDGTSVSHDVIPEHFKWTRTEGVDTPTESAMLINMSDGEIPFTTLTEGALVVHNISTTAGMQALDDGRNYVYFEGSLDLLGAVYGSTTNVLTVNNTSTALDAFYDNTLLHIDFSESTVVDSSPFARSFVENTMGTTTINGLSAGQTNDGSQHILIDGVGDSDLTSWDFTCILVLELGETLGSYDSYFLWQWRVGWSIKDNMFKLGGGSNLRDRNSATSPDWRYAGNQVILVAKHNQTTMTYTIYDLQDGSVYGSTSGTVTPEMITYIQTYTFGYPTTSGREVLIGAGFKHDSLGYVEGSNSKYGEVIFINQYVENDAELNIVNELRTKWVPSTAVSQPVSSFAGPFTAVASMPLADSTYPIGNADRTITAWMQLNASGYTSDYNHGRYTIVHLGVVGQTAKSFGLQVRNDRLGLIGWGNDYWDSTSAHTLNDFNEHFVAVTWNGSTNTATGYVDGQLAWTTNMNAFDTPSGPVDIGRSIDRWDFNFGVVRDVSIYDVVLTSEEVMQNYNAGLADQVTAPEGSTLTVLDVPVEQRSFSDSHHETGLQNSKLDYTKGWAAANPVTGGWIQMDLGQNTVISGVITKGRNDAPQWVTRIQVETSLDDTTWDLVLADVPANTDATTQVTNEFPELVNARYVRITVMEFYGHPAMRAAVLGYTAS
jgi:hypothetical protein